jgi:hypothetical protein
MYSEQESQILNRYFVPMMQAYLQSSVVKRHVYFACIQCLVDVEDKGFLDRHTKGTQSIALMSAMLLSINANLDDKTFIETMRNYCKTIENSTNSLCKMRLTKGIKNAEFELVDVQKELGDDDIFNFMANLLSLVLVIATFDDLYKGFYIEAFFFAILATLLFISKSPEYSSSGTPKHFHYFIKKIAEHETTPLNTEKAQLADAILDNYELVSDTKYRLLVKLFAATDTSGIKAVSTLYEKFNHISLTHEQNQTI